jgi:hypothetical protein
MAGMSPETVTHVWMAAIHRPTDCGVDLPPGSNAGTLVATDYRIVEMAEVGIEMAAVHRTNDIGIDLPPGASADQLSTLDYRPIEMDG